MKIVAFWDEFVHFSRMNVSLSDMEQNTQDVLVSNDGVDRLPSINASNESDNELAPHETNLELPNVSIISKEKIADKSNVQIIKKEAIDSKSQSVSTHAKVEPDIPEIVETYEKDNVLLSHKKLDTCGNLLMNTEKKEPICDDKNDNALQRLEASIISQSALMSSLSNKTDSLSNK